MVLCFCDFPRKIKYRSKRENWEKFLLILTVFFCYFIRLNWLYQKGKFSSKDSVLSFQSFYSIFVTQRKRKIVVLLKGKPGLRKKKVFFIGVTPSTKILKIFFIPNFFLSKSLLFTLQLLWKLWRFEAFLGTKKGLPLPKKKLFRLNHNLP